MAGQVIAIDFDHTIFNNEAGEPYAGVQEAFDEIHMRGHSILIHSCNNPKWIRQQLDKFNLRAEYVWGETGLEGGKPVAACYVDDRAHHFKGDWNNEIHEILARVEGRPVRDFRGPVYRGNPDRTV